MLREILGKKDGVPGGQRVSRALADADIDIG